MSRHHARVVWEGGDDRRAHRIELADQVLASSSAPEFGGDTTKSNPEELLAAALSSCHMLWFLALARKEGFTLAAYEDSAEATLEEDRFTGAILRPKVVWKGDAPDHAALAALHEEAHSRCFVANSVNFPVEVRPDE
ncbi:MAG: OsmC family protein [Solirubrobacterales bacterium]